MTVNNIITYNNNIILNSDNSNSNINNNTYRLRGHSFNDKLLDNHHNINIINAPIMKGILTKTNNNNFLINTNNNIFFTKMRITGINNKKNKKELSATNQLKRINIDINNDENKNRNSSYNKNIKSILLENKNDIKEIPNKDNIILAIPNFNSNTNINKHITFKKLNEAEYNRAYGNKKGIEINVSNNLGSNSHINQELNMHNIKPLVLKTDKFQQNENNINNKINITTKNIGKYQINNTSNNGIKFNNIIKLNTHGMGVNYNYKLRN
jgi:hypothetical protein